MADALEDAPKSLLPLPLRAVVMQFDFLSNGKAFNGQRSFALNDAPRRVICFVESHLFPSQGAWAFGSTMT